MQAEDVRESFLFVNYLNVHHQEWLDSTITNRYVVAPFDFFFLNFLYLTSRLCLVAISWLLAEPIINVMELLTS